MKRLVVALVLLVTVLFVGSGLAFAADGDILSRIQER